LIDNFDKTDSVEYYHGFTSERRTDPLTKGETDSIGPIQNPRLYFLRVWEVRIGQVASEWDGIIRRLEQIVTKYVPY
jgi:hypothetical protein